MYYLYLDESGASRDIHELILNSNEVTCKFFTIGGIIVNDESKTHFKSGYDIILKTYFDSELPNKFKLHFDELRNAHFDHMNLFIKNLITQLKKRFQIVCLM